jgi:hypothetical protein
MPLRERQFMHRLGEIRDRGLENQELPRQWTDVT